MAELAVQAAEDPKFVCALSSKEHTVYLSFFGPNNPPLSSPKFGSCLLGVSVWHYITKPLWLYGILAWFCSFKVKILQPTKSHLVKHSSSTYSNVLSMLFSNVVRCLFLLPRYSNECSKLFHSSREFYTHYVNILMAFIRGSL